MEFPHIVQYIYDYMLDIMISYTMLPRCVQELQRLAKLGNLERVVVMLESDKRLASALNADNCHFWLTLLHKALSNTSFLSNETNRTTIGNYFVMFFDPNATNEQGETLLVKLVRYPTFNFILEEVCRAGVDCNKPGMFAKTALMHAVESCNLRGFQILCQHGADVHKRDMIGETVAHKLANKLYNNDLVNIYADFIDAILDICISKKLNLNLVDNFYSTPLRIAVRNCANGLIIKLLDRDCNVEPRLYIYDTGMTLLHAYISHSNKPEWDATVFQRLLLCNLSKVDCCAGKYQQGHSTPLVYAVQRRNMRAIQLLLMVNCDVNVPDGDITENVMYATLKTGYDRRLITMLIASGYSMSSMWIISQGLIEVDSWYIERVNRKQQIVNELPNLPFTLVSYEHIYVTKSTMELQDFHSLASNPLSLLLLARITIRKTLGQGVLQPKINQLPLPPPLKNFIYRVDICDTASSRD